VEMVKVVGNWAWVVSSFRRLHVPLPEVVM
jgi:hypothetical protein